MTKLNSEYIAYNIVHVIVYYWNICIWS